ncbi:MAG: [FeFe] hydrogenase, group A [Spirochaetaceae bacterium]|nr:[FeFe] hydrogenase, group A [Spirochaetaceae bacterium]
MSVSLTVDGNKVTVPDHTSVLEAAAAAHISIPTLCRHEDLVPKGACGMCIVKIGGQTGFKRSCVTEAREGMSVWTSSPEIRDIRRGILELVLAAHPADCLQCIKHGKCELQTLAERFEIRDLHYDRYTRGLPVDQTSLGIVRDMNKCIGCGRCVEMCNETQTVASIFFRGRGADTIVAPTIGKSMGDSVCVNCGQCVVYCPVGALYEREQIDEVWKAIDDPDKIVVAQIAPAVRVAIGEEFGLEPGELCIGKLYSALKGMGVDVVFDTNFSADLTILEEGTELLGRIREGGPFPLITSCSPGWIKFCETFYPELLGNVSSCKSPQQMLGALIKTYYATQREIDPARLVSLSIMPCTAKKFEARRPEMNASGLCDVDFVLTTREIARMFRQAGICFADLDESAPDPLLSGYTGAATIFGASGGVMEAALRTAYELATGKSLARIDFSEVRGMQGVKEATVDMDGLAVKIAVTNGLGNARKILDTISAANKLGKPSYHFVEIMACSGGCIGGGGQPLPNTQAKRARRMEGLYMEDRGLALRKSHENPEVKRIYAEFLGSPGSSLAHKLLHTSYLDRREAASASS